MPECNILPDSILDTIVCHTCSNYLSVLPIKVYPNKRIKCGRCVQGTDSGVPSLYERVVKNIKFPCINRYDGCKVLLSLNETTKHEKTCKSKTYNCPVKTCSDKGTHSLLDLLSHFRTRHENQLLLDEIKVTIDDSKANLYRMVYLHRKSNNLYWVVLTILNKNSGQVTVTNVCGENLVPYEVQIFTRNPETYESKNGSTTRFKINAHEENTNIQVYVKLKESDVFTVIAKNASAEIVNDELENTNDIVETTNLRKKFGYEFSLNWTDNSLSVSECKTKLILYKKVTYLVQCPLCSYMSSLVWLNTLGNNPTVTNIICDKCSNNSQYHFLKQMLLMKCRFNCSRRFSIEQIAQHEAECRGPSSLGRCVRQNHNILKITESEFKNDDTFKYYMLCSRNQLVVISITKSNLSKIEIKLDSFLPPVEYPEKIIFLIRIQNRNGSWDQGYLLNINKSIKMIINQFSCLYLSSNYLYTSPN